jgi:hypothetical protein
MSTLNFALVLAGIESAELPNSSDTSCPWSMRSEWRSELLRFNLLSASKISRLT